MRSKSIISMILILTLSISLLAACSSNNNDEAEQASSPSAAGTDNSSGENDKYTAPFDGQKFTTPVKMTTVRVQGGDVKFKNGETMEDNVHTRWAKEKLGIEIETLWTAANNEAFAGKIRLALASNEKLPDVIALRDGTLDQELIDTGKFMEVGELFEKYAGDTWKEAIKDYPNTWWPYMRDGKKYGIPILDYAYNEDEVMFIREDWLRNLNLKAPTTIDEFEQVLDAFTNQDPDGNNQNDTFGMTLGFKNNLNTWMSGASSIFGAYGALPNIWYEKDGKLVYGSVQPELKNGLEKLRSWMEKGYLPKDAGLFDEVKASDLFVGGQAGIILGPHWMPTWPLNGLDSNVPGSEFKAYPVPAGPDGTIMRHGTKVNNGVVLINKDYDHPDAFMVYYNYLFENYANPPVGGEFEYGMAEGYDWAMVDGKPTTDPNLIPGGEAAVTKYTLTFDGARIPALEMETLDALANGKTPETPYEKRDATKDPRWIYAGSVALQQIEHSYVDAFVGQPTPTMKDKLTLLKQMESETLAKVIYGEASMEDFDKFVEKWNSSGGSKITDEVNEWYATVNQ